MRQRILPVLVFLLAALLLPPLALGKFPTLSLPSFAPQSADEEDLGWIGESVPSSQASRAEEVILPADSLWTSPSSKSSTLPPGRWKQSRCGTMSGSDGS